jgi:hypothetical protein
MARTSHKRPREVLASARTGKFTRGEVRRVIDGVHVIPRGHTSWMVKRMGPGQASRTFSDRDAAIEWARQLAHSPNAMIYIHRRDGRVITQASGKSRSRARP